MHYVKVLQTHRLSLEKDLNALYQTLQEQNHRVQYTKAHWFEDGGVDVLIVISDSPHPHAEKKV